MVQLTSTGEVAVFAEADQFPAGKSQFMCGYFACYIAASMAQIGQTPRLTALQIIAQAEAAYAVDSGGDSISIVDGMTNEEEYNLLHKIGLHYQAIATDISQVKAWVQVGYPVIIGITETSVWDLALNKNPYPWTPAGSHIILVTGVTADGNVLARDSANCTNLYDPNSLRPGPRKYQASKLQLVSATVVVPPWLSRPASATAPSPQEAFMGTPQGQQAQAYWNSTTQGSIPVGGNAPALAGIFLAGQAPSFSTGIAKSWQTEYNAGRVWGPPISYEFATVDWQGNAIVAQMFVGGRCEWANGAKWYAWGK